MGLINISHAIPLQCRTRNCSQGLYDVLPRVMKFLGIISIAPFFFKIIDKKFYFWINSITMLKFVLLELWQYSLIFCNLKRFLYFMSLLSQPLYKKVLHFSIKWFSFSARFLYFASFYFRFKLVIKFNIHKDKKVSFVSYCINFLNNTLQERLTKSATYHPYQKIN